MHVEVMDWLRARFRELPGDLHVFEIGAKAINGTARQAPAPGQVRAWWGCDLVSGAGVDFVGGGDDAVPPWSADVVVCCEVLEHTPLGQEILANAARQLRPGGALLVTMATEPRAPHSAVDGGPLRQGEYYANVHAATLAGWLRAAGFTEAVLVTDAARGDLWASARRR
jgi:hypothetical protein